MSYTRKGAEKRYFALPPPRWLTVRRVDRVRDCHDHTVLVNIDLADIADALAGLVKAGAVRFIGATTVEQLAIDIARANAQLDDDVIAGIEAIQRAWPDPCPWFVTREEAVQAQSDSVWRQP